jgi:hypothetical protein
VRCNYKIISCAIMFLYHGEFSLPEKAHAPSARRLLEGVSISRGNKFPRKRMVYTRNMGVFLCHRGYSPERYAAIIQHCVCFYITGEFLPSKAGRPTTLCSRSHLVSISRGNFFPRKRCFVSPRYVSDFRHLFEHHYTHI